MCEPRHRTAQRNCLASALTIAVLLALAACRTQQISPKHILSKPPAPPLILSERNIVVTQDEYTNEPCGGGRLHVWSYNRGEYENTWTAKTFQYSSLAIGDIDGDPKREIIALGNCKMTEIKQRDVIDYHKYFICVYKEDAQVGQNEMGLWKTTYLDGLKNNIKEDESYYPQYSWCREIALADVDGDSTNEIIVLTAHWLTIYEYDPNAVSTYDSSSGALKKIAEVHPSFSKYPLRLKSVTVRDGDTKPGKEIVVSANRERIVKYISGEFSRHIEDDGYLFFYNFNEGTLELSSHLSIEAFLTDQSLRSGDLDNDGDSELCSTGFKKEGDMYQGYIFIWDHTSEWECHEIRVGVPENLGSEEGFEPYTPRNHIEVGELNAEHPGDEIALALQHQMRITLCYWKGAETLATINNATLYEYHFVEIENVYIADADGDAKNEIIVIGAGRSGPESGRFYLEIFDQNLTRKWIRLGGNPKETHVASAAIG